MSGNCSASAARHALYFAPAPEHPLWQAGSRWLGRDACAGQPLTTAPESRAAPWHYGFHATLKAPLHLAEGVSESHWLQAVSALAARHAPFDMPPLAVAMLGDFLALRPAATDAPCMRALHRLADDAVMALDGLRAPPSVADSARLTSDSMSDRQRAQVQRWGYAHVLEDWRFHMTLSDGLGEQPEDTVQALRQAAQRHFEPVLTQALRCDAVCVFSQARREAPFFLTHRIGLSGRAALA